ncbi:Calcineurin-like_phosphoesterase superfamily domain-containing protein [Hexamita inflata]|uniref:Calcineurin-like phosphoesterase superfamily domain-containing protein n=1 Tax=Hexamita inflata TaxID=28002 RepID=A0AA86RPZ6_9EUKA|nr:Calcineurin-like phosphoesterase superfamily domain-containing protein [Hexamita inflata]CAI9977508.1 Calcineurin-like phosphoesterase superfamily domain-containing protein [Hexamita inflata]
MIILGGDFMNFKTWELDSQEVIQENTSKIEDLVQCLLTIAPTYFVLGNHDCINANNSKHYLKQPMKLSEDLYLVPQSGSSSTILERSQNPLEIDADFWEGYPYGPQITEELAEFRAFQESRLDQNTLLLNQKQNLPDLESCSYNRNQVFDLSSVPDTAKLFIVSHQGPYSSATACDDVYGFQFSSGSPNNQIFYQQNKHRIVRWLHGHTHQPINRENGKIVNPGKFVLGHCVLVDDDEVQFYNID